MKPDIGHLKLFGSRVCVKQSGKRRSKLDHHDFKGIFLGYTATDQNIIYLDLDSGIVKRSHHAQFDEAWYLQDTQPPTAQLLYDLGVTLPLGLVNDAMAESDVSLEENIATISVPWPPVTTSPLKEKGLYVPVECTQIPLPLQHTPMVTTGPRQVGAKAAFAHAPISPARRARVPRARDIMLDFDISRTGMSMIYMSPDPYFDAFEEILQLKLANLQKNATAGLTLYESNGRVHLAGMAPGTPAAKIPDWRTHVKGAWLIKMGIYNGRGTP